MQRRTIKPDGKAATVHLDLLFESGNTQGALFEPIQLTNTVYSPTVVH